MNRNERMEELLRDAICRLALTSGALIGLGIRYNRQDMIDQAMSSIKLIGDMRDFLKEG